VPRTFLNEETCAVRTDCTAPIFSGDLELNAANPRKFYEIDSKFSSLPCLTLSTMTIVSLTISISS